MGPQSTGKSTLSNALFDTKFIVLNENNLNKQTTKGIHLQINKEQSKAIFDIEGMDSLEASE